MPYTLELKVFQSLVAQNELKELTQHITTAILTGNNPNSACSQMK